MTCEKVEFPVDIDIEALRAKYKQERDKRVRPDGEDQYFRVSEDDFVDYFEHDPWSPPVVRDAISEDIDVAILGGGFAGLMMGSNLRKLGVDDFRILEMGGDFGGTWYWNRYPGLQCDNESYCYLPLLDEIPYVPAQKYANGFEIYEHCRRIGQHFDLYRAALFGTLTRSLRWDEAIKRWRITTNHGDDIRARFIVMCAGTFNRAKLPGAPGLTDFKGHSFHTSRWDYGYTGGSPLGGLHKLNDKRVAIIGTGATGIQVIPYLAQDAKHLYVFQRTPSAVDFRNNRPTDPVWKASLKPGWQRARQENFNAAVWEGLKPGLEDQVCDGWSEINRNLIGMIDEVRHGKVSLDELEAAREVEDYRYMEKIRRRVDKVIEDKQTAETLKAWYRFNCKRPTFNDEYLATFNRPNVTLVDVSATRGVERITEKGLIAGGVEYEVDCIIYASGFEVTTSMKRTLGIEVVEGRNGLSLYDHWKDGFKTFHGWATHGFPNQFFTGYTQGGVSVNLPSMLNSQTEHIGYVIKQAVDRGAEEVEATEAAQTGWCEIMRNVGLKNEQFLLECTPGYYNNEGEKPKRAHIGEVYGPGINAFNALLAEWRDKGSLDGVVLKRGGEVL